MKIASRKKIFDGYKSEYPEKTIGGIKKFFNSIDFAPTYIEREFTDGKSSLYVGYFKEVPGINGKGVSSELCQASAYVELYERLVSEMVSVDGVSDKIRKMKTKKRAIRRLFYHKINPLKLLNHFLIEGKPRINVVNKDWVDAYSLCKGKYYRVPDSFIRHISGPNGLGAGNNIEEAIVHSFCEICERYSLITHLKKRSTINTINQKTIKSDVINQYISYFNDNNIDIIILDFTIDNSIPVMGVLFEDKNIKNNKGINRKLYFRKLILASHLNLERAIIRCFLEGVQSGITDYNLANDIIYNENITPHIDIINNFFSEKEHQIITDIVRENKKSLTSLFQMMVDFEDYDFLLKDSEVINFSDLTSLSNNDFAEDIDNIREIAQKNNWEILITDYSVKDCPIKAIRMIIPTISDLLKYKNDDKLNSLAVYLPYSFKSISNIQKMNLIECYTFLKYTLLPEMAIPIFPLSIKKYIPPRKILMQMMCNLLQIAIVKKKQKTLEQKINTIKGNDNMLVTDCYLVNHANSELTTHNDKGVVEKFLANREILFLDYFINKKENNDMIIEINANKINKEDWVSVVHNKDKQAFMVCKITKI